MRASEFVTEAWSQKRKCSVNDKQPRGFSQRAPGQGRKKSVSERRQFTEMELAVMEGGHSLSDLP